MKRKLLASAMLCALAYPIASSSQTSVTLYGVIDEGFDYTKNVGGHSNVQLASGLHKAADGG